MPAIPSFVLKKLYVKGSLRAENDGFALDLRNSIAPATITAFTGLEVDDQRFTPSQVTVILPDGRMCTASDVSAQAPLSFPLNTTATLHAPGKILGPGPHKIAIHIVVQDVGPLDIPIVDVLT